MIQSHLPTTVRFGTLDLLIQFCHATDALDLKANNTRSRERRGASRRYGSRYEPTASALTLTRSRSSVFRSGSIRPKGNVEHTSFESGDSNLNVLRVISSMDPKSGGPCQGLRNLIPELEQLGISNEVVCCNDDTESFVGKDDFPVHAVGSGKTSWCYQPALRSWLDKNLHRFDAVICHGLWQYSLCATRQAVEKQRKSGRSGLSFYVMPHGMLDPWFQRSGSRRIKAIRNWFYWKVLERKNIECADGVLFTCQRELELARETFRPYRPQAELNVGYGVAAPPKQTPEMISAFLDRCPEIRGTDSNARPYLLFLSRIHPKKGVDILIEAYKQLRSEAGSSHQLPALVIAGPDDSDFANEMKNLAGDAGDNDIHFCGMLSGDEKWGALYGCEAFILPSHQENFGIAVVEALACGRPVLISDQINIFEEIENAGAGLVENDDLEGVGSLLRQWIEMSDNGRSTMADAAGRCYEKCFLPSVAATSLAKVLLADSPTPAAI